MNICEENAKRWQAAADSGRKMCSGCAGRPPVGQDACIQRQISARLADEVRTPISRRNINLLRKQVQSGTYQVNPSAIASSMLLQRECYAGTHFPGDVQTG